MGLLAHAPAILPAQKQGPPGSAAWSNTEDRIQWKRLPPVTSCPLPRNAVLSHPNSTQLQKLANLLCVGPVLALPGAPLGYWARVGSKALPPARNGTFATLAPMVYLCRASTHPSIARVGQQSPIEGDIGPLKATYHTTGHTTDDVHSGLSSNFTWRLCMLCMMAKYTHTGPMY